MAKHNWTDAKIYIELKNRKGEYADSIRNLLERPEVMPAIEKILDSGGTTPKDFTLHDSEHSFRVAERMWDLIPQKTKDKISDYELGFLLLSAFLHDIGMSPDFEKVEKHSKFLSEATKDQLEDAEIYEFQKWIDNDSKAKSLDIKKEIVNDNELLTYILAYYVRSKHNDWSGEWIKKNLSKYELKDYRNWSDDLILVCKSHHYGFDQLIKEAFDPKPVGPSMTIHLRYISMCLRMSDVMENDPERTPDVILRHRKISESSLKYWLKDKQFDLVRKDNKFSVFARPEKAYLHKAIEETVQWIEDELKLCDELAKAKPLNYSVFHNIEHYEWGLGTSIHKNISPKDDSYVYIQGAFRPNTAKILELLGGNQLYGDSISAYRELIQNSLDAIKERIAYKVIDENANTANLIKRLGELYSIEIGLEKREDGYWLSCRDQGVGMTKNIIEKFFLESGSSRRHEISELERRCKTVGFNFQRTGQFGIGVLSYFMIADKVVVKTKRELNTGYSDDESQAWYFEISGTHDFGELRKLNNSIIGTHIELRLNKNIEKDIDIWDFRFAEFIKETITISPCIITYTSLKKELDQKIDAGWSNNSRDIKLKIIEKLKSEVALYHGRDDGMRSMKEEKLRSHNYSLMSQVYSEIANITDYLYEEGELEGVGKYRIFIPYFKLIGGNSFTYLKEFVDSKTHQIVKIFKGHYWRPNFDEIFFSLKGIKINAIGKNNEREFNIRRFGTPINNAFVEFDVENILEGNLSVSRHSLILKDESGLIIKFLYNKILALISANKPLFKNIYSLLNEEYVKETLDIPYWPIKNYDNNGSLFWKIVECPASNTTDSSSTEKFKYLGKKVDVSVDIMSFTDRNSINWFNKVDGEFVYTLPVRNKLNLNRVSDYSIIMTSFSKNRSFHYKFIDCPKTWSNLLFVSAKYKGYDKSDIFINRTFSKSFDLDFLNVISNQELKISVEQLNTKKKCLSFLLSSVIAFNETKFDALCEQRPDVMSHVFKMLNQTEFILLSQLFIITISPLGWTEDYFFDKTFVTKNLEERFNIQTTK